MLNAVYFDRASWSLTLPARSQQALRNRRAKHGDRLGILGSGLDGSSLSSSSFPGSVKPDVYACNRRRVRTARSRGRDLKLRPGELVHAWQTAFQFENAMAVIALEVMMVTLAGSLIDGRATRQFHQRQPAFFEQRLDIPVDSSNANPIHLFLRQFQDLLGR